MISAHNPSDIDRFFRGLTEYAFHTRLGIVDPPLVDYVSLLLVRFLRTEPAVPSRGSAAVVSADVARLLVEAAGQRASAEAREECRHIGDLTLFWSGLYPEALRRVDTPGCADRRAAYREMGKRAYQLASVLEPADAAEARRLFEQLSEEYDLCVEGLSEVRKIWGEG